MDERRWHPTALNVNTGDDLDVTWWWEADCGATHIETNPVVISPHCAHSEDAIDG